MKPRKLHIKTVKTGRDREERAQKWALNSDLSLLFTSMLCGSWFGRP